MIIYKLILCFNLLVVFLIQGKSTKLLETGKFMQIILEKLKVEALLYLF